LEFRLQQGFDASVERVEVEAGSIISESVFSTKTIFSYNMQKKVVEMFNNILYGKTKGFVKSSLIVGLLYGFGPFVMFCTFATLFYSGSSFMINDGIPLNYFLKAMFVLIFGAFGLGFATQYIGDYAAAKEALVDIFRIIDHPVKIDPESGEMKNKSHEEINGRIEFKNVSFAYPIKPEFTVLKNISFIIEPGQSGAFVGYSGSGKSTIVQLIQRFYDVDEGEILVDGINIKDYDINHYRKKISIVMQEPVLFKTDIETNIKYGKLDADQADIYEAAKKAEITKFLEPDYDNKVLPVSGGEKQRLAIARAIIKNPVILLLDEATSALDKQNEELVQKSLDDIMIGKTTVCIAHRLSTIQNYNKIFVMDKGEIIENGTHDQLMQLNGKYATLFNYGKK
jgi:ATP-binding cassette subfamily B (MDR/TAP) protein 1